MSIGFFTGRFRNNSSLQTGVRLSSKSAVDPFKCEPTRSALPLVISRSLEETSGVCPVIRVDIQTAKSGYLFSKRFNLGIRKYIANVDGASTASTDLLR